MYFLSPCLDVTRISMSRVYFLTQLDSRILCLYNPFLSFKAESSEKYCLKKRDFISQVYKKLKILKFCHLFYLQSCLFMSQIETNQRVANSFVDLRHCSDNKNYLTKSNAKGLLDIPFIDTQIYGT